MRSTVTVRLEHGLVTHSHEVGRDGHAPLSEREQRHGWSARARSRTGLDSSLEQERGIVVQRGEEGLLRYNVERIGAPSQLFLSL